MKEIIIWDKKSKINGIDALDVINSMNIKDTDDVLLVFDGVRVTNIEFVSVLKSVYNLDVSLTAGQVAKEYIRVKEEERLQAKKEQTTLEEQVNKISILEEENKELREELTQIQTSIASLISTLSEK